MAGFMLELVGGVVGAMVGWLVWRPVGDALGAQISQSHMRAPAKYQGVHAKASVPMLVTEAGIVTLVRLVHHLKA